LDRTFFSYDQAKQLAKEAIEYYNQIRPHATGPPGGCNYLTPNQAHEHSGPMVKKWRLSKRKAGKIQNPIVYKTA